MTARAIPAVATDPADDFFGSMITSIQNRRGATGAFMASDFGKYQQGIPIPHLMMEYIFGLNVIPMPSLIEFAGPPGSCKSAFLQYIMSIFAALNMRGVYVETENKASNTLLESFLGEEGSKRVLFIPGPMTMEDWEAEILNALKNYRAAYAASVAKHAKNTTHPVLPPLCLGLDSLTGGSSKESIAATDKDGKTGRSYPVEALILSKFFPQIPTRMRDLPMVFIYTNHEQQRMEEKKGPFTVQGPRRSQGGQRPDFYCGIRMFFEQENKPERLAGNVKKQRVVIEVGKNSFNESRQRISLPMYWETTVNDDNNESTQRTWFGWEEALAEFLAPDKGGPKYDSAAVKRFLNVKRESATAFSCRELGLVRVSPEELGKAIEADTELVAKLRPYLGVKSWKVWDGNPVSANVEAELDLPDPEPVEIPATEEADGTEG